MLLKLQELMQMLNWSQNHCSSIRKTLAFRRAMKQSMQRTMRAGAQGVKVMVSGRLGGAEIARSDGQKKEEFLFKLKSWCGLRICRADTMMGKSVLRFGFQRKLDANEQADMILVSKKSRTHEDKPSGERRLDVSSRNGVNGKHKQ